MKISKAFTSTDSCSKNIPAGNSGFTLLELIVSMTIISMVVLVLYFAFSMGARTWKNEDLRDWHEGRLEATMRLVQEDLLNSVPYTMNWEKGTISLFTGGPRFVSYVTGNGTGAFSGTGSGLFFSFLFVDECPETEGSCLFLYKSSRPSPEFVRTVDEFLSGSEFQREYFLPGTEIAEQSMLIKKNLDDLNISYSNEEFIPFAGTGHGNPDTYLQGDNVLSEKYWTSQELPGQIRFVFSFEEREFIIQVPVGN